MNKATITNPKTGTVMTLRRLTITTNEGNGGMVTRLANAADENAFEIIQGAVSKGCVSEAKAMLAIANARAAGMPVTEEN